LNSIYQNRNHRVCGPRFEFTNVSSICSYVNQAADIDRLFDLLITPLLPVFNIISESKNHHSSFGGAVRGRGSQTERTISSLIFENHGYEP
jgi:hypothetical protein